MLGVVLSPLYAQKASLNIVTIGDSHGAHENGWVNQLKKLHPADSFLNFAVSGNTLGFDNLGKESLNELKNLERQLTEANQTFKKIDYIIILLGTNDCKAVYDSLQRVVPANLEKVLARVTGFHYTSSKPVVILATPPPIAEDTQMEAKYQGSKLRLKKLLPHYKRLSKKYHCQYVDTNTPLQPDFHDLNTDGIHLTEAGYQMIAHLISDALSSRKPLK